MALFTASLFKTGNTPGKPKSTAQACELASAPYLVEAAEKILEFVLSCAWISKPMTVSHSMVNPPVASFGANQFVAGTGVQY